jgi:hypothetical protein
MLHRWTDINGVEHKVLDDYRRNVTLCDLTAQPQDIKEAIDQSIKDQLRVVPKTGVGIHLMKFLAKYELAKISDNIDSYGKWLNATYDGPFKE